MEYKIGEIVNGKIVVGFFVRRTPDGTTKKCLRMKCIKCGRITKPRMDPKNRINRCQCVVAESRSIGYERTEDNIRLHHTLLGMLYRCENPKCDTYYRYGGKGIRVCEEWKDVYAFIKWAKESGYKNGLTIDRIDPNGNYCPENCRWVTRGQNTSFANVYTQRRYADKGTYYAKDPDGTIYNFVNASKFAKEHNLIPAYVRNYANKNGGYNGWFFTHDEEKIK